MPFSMTVDHDRKRIHSHASGDIDSNEIFSTTLETLQDPVLSTYNEVMDARDVGKIDFSSNQSFDLAAFVESIDVPAGRRFAVVVSSDLTRGLANQYSSLIAALAGDRIQVGVFEIVEEAETWAFEEEGRDA